MSLVCGQRINRVINRNGDFLGFEYLMQENTDIRNNQSFIDIQYLQLDRPVKSEDYQQHGMSSLSLLVNDQVLKQFIDITDTFDLDIPTPPIFLGSTFKEGTHEVKFRNGGINYETFYKAFKISPGRYVLDGEIVTQTGIGYKSTDCVQKYNMGVLTQTDYYRTYGLSRDDPDNKPYLSIWYKDGYIIRFKRGDDYSYTRIKDGFRVVETRQNSIKFYDFILVKSKLMDHYIRNGIEISLPSDRKSLKIEYGINGGNFDRETYYNQFRLIPRIIDYLIPYFPKEIVGIIENYTKDYGNLPNARDFLIGIRGGITNVNVLDTIDKELVMINSIIG